MSHQKTGKGVNNGTNLDFQSSQRGSNRKERRKIRILNLGLISNCELVTAHIVFNLDFNPNLMFRTKLLTFLVT